MDDNKKSLGKIGEKIVANYMNRQGCIVEQSLDPFDSQKDMKIDGKSLEVKTQVPFVTKNCFTLEKNQLKKCQNVDYLVFVQAPCEYWNEAALYQVDPKAFKFRKHTMKDKEERYIIPINQPAVNKLCPIEGHYKKELRRYATNYNG